MRTSKPIIQRLSLRCKFKDANTVEVTVLDHVEGETFQIFWQFRQAKISLENKKSKADKSSDEIERQRLVLIEEEDD